MSEYCQILVDSFDILGMSHLVDLLDASVPSHLVDL